MRGAAEATESNRIQDKRFYQPLHRCSLREEWLVQVWSTFYNNLGQDFVYCCYSPSFFLLTRHGPSSSCIFIAYYVFIEYLY